jgi:TonB-dependent SusC/RagA subfamily outer membrane receptor
MDFKLFIIFGLSVLFLQTVHAQQRVLVGKVTTVHEIPLNNVLLELKNAERGILTDSTGRFALTCNENERISVSAKGFVTKKIKVSDVPKHDSLHIDLKLKSGKKNHELATNNKHISRHDLSHAIAYLEAGPDYSTYSTILDAMQSRVSGLTITNNSIVIRGNTSLNSGPIPALLIVDGTIVDFPVFVGIPPIEVKSIKVIKDAAASSVYGSQGMGGVIVVKTKSNN